MRTANRRRQRPLTGCRQRHLNDRDRRKAERPVLRVVAIRRDVVWPKAEWLLRSSFVAKADGLPPTQRSRSEAILRLLKPDACSAFSFGGDKSISASVETTEVGTSCRPSGFTPTATPGASTEGQGYFRVVTLCYLRDPRPRGRIGRHHRNDDHGLHGETPGSGHLRRSPRGVAGSADHRRRLGPRSHPDQRLHSGVILEHQSEFTAAIQRPCNWRTSVRTHSQ